MNDKENMIFMEGIREGMTATLIMMQQRLKALQGDESVKFEFNDLAKNIEKEIAEIDIYLIEMQNTALD